ncbi:DUF3093 domain-containing protein [Mycobacterium sp.]|uniref:DUF3093 domain-containing protein n=1 Tax=Mycobacterium sp. TaxID=1785 RepID=UPI0039C90F82
MSEGPTGANTSETAVEPLFFEIGATWYWVLAGPISALIMLWIEIDSGLGPQWLVPACFLVLVSGFVALQVHAARIHTSVELTHHTLRQGTEELPVAQIVRVYQELPISPKSDMTPHKWQSARALGELTHVPKGRVGIGLKLTQGREVQAWARRHRQLREALTQLVDEHDKRPRG